MNIQRKNSAHHFRMQSEREQTLDTSIVTFYICFRQDSIKIRTRRSVEHWTRALTALGKVN